jgi:HEAT repeat protein
MDDWLPATVAAIIVLVGGLIYALRSIRVHSPGGFRDRVKNPGYRQFVSEEAARYIAARDAIEVPDDIAADEIEAMVERLFEKENRDFNFERLQKVGERALPFLLRAIREPRALTPFAGPLHALEPQTAFERNCSLLGAIAAPETVEVVSPFVCHTDDDVRKEVALLLGQIGSSACIAPVGAALADDDDYVRSNAMKGIQESLSAERAGKPFLDAMIAPFTELLDRCDMSDNGDAPRVLLAISAENALPILLSERFFTTQNDELYHIIEAVNEAGLRISHDRLLPLLDELAPRCDEYPFDCSYTAALIAYARNPDAAAADRIRAELQSSNHRIQEGAARALGELYQMPDACGVVLDRYRAAEFDGLTPQQQVYYIVFRYDVDVTNGGHASYFVHSGGDRWRTTLNALTTVGAVERAAILQDACDLFGPGGPPEENEARHHQLARFTRRQDKQLEALDERYSQCEENVCVLLMQYAIEHREHFVRNSE